MKKQAASFLVFLVIIFCMPLNLNAPRSKPGGSTSPSNSSKKNQSTKSGLNGESLSSSKSSMTSSFASTISRFSSTNLNQANLDAQNRVIAIKKVETKALLEKEKIKELEKKASQVQQDLVALFKENEDLKSLSPESFVDFARGFGSETTEEGQILLDKAFSRTPAGIKADKKIHEAKKLFDKAQAIKIDEDLPDAQKLIATANKLDLLTNTENALLAAIEQRKTEKEKVLTSFRKSFSKVENKDLIFSDPDKTKRLDALLKEISADRNPKPLTIELKGQALANSRRKTTQDYSGFGKNLVKNDRLSQLQNAKPALETNIAKQKSTVAGLEEQRKNLNIELGKLNEEKSKLEFELNDAEYESVFLQNKPKLKLIITQIKENLRETNTQISKKTKQVNEVNKQLNDLSESLSRDQQKLEETKTEISRVKNQMKKTQVQLATPQLEGFDTGSATQNIKNIKAEMARLERENIDKDLAKKRLIKQEVSQLLRINHLEMSPIQEKR